MFIKKIYICISVHWLDDSFVCADGNFILQFFYIVKVSSKYFSFQFCTMIYFIISAIGKLKIKCNLISKCMKLFLGLEIDQIY